MRGAGKDGQNLCVQAVDNILQYTNVQRNQTKYRRIYILSFYKLKKFIDIILILQIYILFKYIIFYSYKVKYTAFLFLEPGKF